MDKRPSFSHTMLDKRPSFSRVYVFVVLSVPRLYRAAGQPKVGNYEVGNKESHDASSRSDDFIIFVPRDIFSQLDTDLDHDSPTGSG